MSHLVLVNHSAAAILQVGWFYTSVRTRANGSKYRIVLDGWKRLNALKRFIKG